MKKNDCKTFILGAVFGVLALLGACEQDGGAVVLTPPAIPAKYYKTDANSTVKAAVYINPEHDAVVNAAAYVLEDGGKYVPFFDYVVISYAYLTKERGYTQIVLTDAARRVLEAGPKHISPLRDRGIKTLLELRSGNFADGEEGVAAGFGVMDEAAINEFKKAVRMVMDKYGLDGFVFNDVGGGTSSYPPATRYAKQFQSGTPLYQNKMFTQDGTDGGQDLSPEEIERILWREGGSNFFNVLQITNDALGTKYTSQVQNGDGTTRDEIIDVSGVIIAHTAGHGGHLVEQSRLNPDAYSGSSPALTGNVNYIINNGVKDWVNHRHIWLGVGEKGSEVLTEKINNDRMFAPFTVDLQTRISDGDAAAWAAAFVQGDSTAPDGTGDSRKYGGLVFRNLPPASASSSDADAADIAAYVSIFSQALFGKNVTVQGSAAYTKDW
jgi:hypothetical protein